MEEEVVLAKNLAILNIFVFVTLLLISFNFSYANENFLFHYRPDNDKSLKEALQVFMPDSLLAKSDIILPLIQKRNPSINLNSTQSKLRKDSFIWLEIPPEYLDANKVKLYFYAQANIANKIEKKVRNPKIENKSTSVKILLGMGNNSETVSLDHNEYTTDAQKQPYVLSFGIKGKDEIYSAFYNKSIFIQGPSFSDYQFDLNYNVKKLGTKVGTIKILGSYTTVERTIFNGEIDDSAKLLSINSHFIGLNAEYFNFSNNKYIDPVILGIKALYPLISSVKGESEIELSQGTYFEAYLSYKILNNILLRGSYSQFSFQSQITSSVFGGTIFYFWEL